MRLSTDEAADEERALETIAAAAGAGITVFDTARAYGDNEALLAGALRRCGADGTARIVTKGGMSRPGGAWRPDGRAKAVRADCEASLVALDGRAIDLYLLHAADPRTPWATSVRALARLVDDGLVARVGVANVTRGQLDEALALAPISAVQVALSLFDDRALRGGVVDRCAEAGVTVIAHSPLGGPRRAKRLDRNQALSELARTCDATPAEVALAWLLGLSPVVVAIPGARRPETARSAARASSLVLDERTTAGVAAAFREPERARPRRRRAEAAEVVVVMGIPGAGKSRVAESYAARGYLRLNRDERGGSLRELAKALDDALASGAGSIVLDNTYLTRASRSYVLEAAHRHGAQARCVWLDTPLAQAQVNLVERLLTRFGALPTPAELREAAKHEQGLLAPTSQMRALRKLEPPSANEGWSSVVEVPFEREPPPRGGRPGVLAVAGAVARPGWSEAGGGGDIPHLVFDWSPVGDDTALRAAAVRLAAIVAGPVETALCPHPAGPPTCWCRPPLPGLALAFARSHQVDLSQSLLVGTGPAHRSLAAALGCRHVSVRATTAARSGPGEGIPSPGVSPTSS